MNLPELTRLFGSAAIWRVTSLRGAGRAIVEALNSQDETVRTIAGMLLVRAGERAESLLHADLRSSQVGIPGSQVRQRVPMVISVLGSIGDPESLPHLRQFAADGEPKIARAARHAINVIEFQGQTHADSRGGVK